MYLYNMSNIADYSITPDETQLKLISQDNTMLMFYLITYTFLSEFPL